MEIYHIMIKRWNSDEEWKKPIFPKSSSDPNYLIHDAEDMKRIYHAIAVFDNDNNIVKEV